MKTQYSAIALAASAIAVNAVPAPSVSIINGPVATPAPINSEGAISGSYSENIDAYGVKGTVNVEGAADGKLSCGEDCAGADGGANGRVTGTIEGFGDFSIEGAAAGVAGVDGDNNKAYAEGGINGRASSSAGYGAEGAASGSAWGNPISQTYGATGSVNGCYNTPDHGRVCYLKSGPQGPGFYDSNSGYQGSEPEPTWIDVSDDNGSGSDSGSSISGSSTSDASSSAKSLGGLLTILAAVGVLAL